MTGPLLNTMAYCTNCGQPQQNGVQACMSCGTQLPGIQLMARLRAEAEQIRRVAGAANGNGMTQINGQQQIVQQAQQTPNQPMQQAQMTTLDRLEEMRRQADALAQRKHMDRHGQQLRW